MRKLSFSLSMLFFVIILFSAGCVSYGRYKPETPVKERVLLELIDLELKQIDQKKETVMWIGDFWQNAAQNVISFPSGRHELVFDYESWTRTATYQSGTTITTEYDVNKADNIPISYDFKAGHHYVIYGVEKDKKVHLGITDLGTNTKLFHNGVYTGGVVTMDAHLGSGGQSYGMAGFGFGYKGVFDIGTPLELSVNGAIDFGLGPGGEYDKVIRYDYNVSPPREYAEYRESSPIGIVGGAFGGVFGHFYIPRTSVSIGAGYGYRAEIAPMTSFGSGSFTSSFVRGEALWGRMGLYFEYYLNPAYLDLPLFGDPNAADFSMFKNWGIGFFGRM